MYFPDQISELRPVQKFSLDPYFKSASVVRISQFRIFIFFSGALIRRKRTWAFHQHTYKRKETKVARAALCIWDYLGSIFSASVATVIELHTFTNPLIRFSLSYRLRPRFNSRTGSWLHFLEDFRRQLCCFFVGQGGTELVSVFARSIDRFEFHPTLRLWLLFLLFFWSSTELLRAGLFQTRGLAIFFRLDEWRTAFWMGRDNTGIAWRLAPFLFDFGFYCMGIGR
jgi:hypothetical protein